MHTLQEETLWMVLPYIQGGSVESAMKYAYPKVRLSVIDPCLTAVIGSKGSELLACSQLLKRTARPASCVKLISD